MSVDRIPDGLDSAIIQAAATLTAAVISSSAGVAATPDNVATAFWGTVAALYARPIEGFPLPTRL